MGRGVYFDESEAERGVLLIGHATGMGVLFVGFFFVLFVRLLFVIP